MRGHRRIRKNNVYDDGKIGSGEDHVVDDDVRMIRCKRMMRCRRMMLRTEDDDVKDDTVEELPPPLGYFLGLLVRAVCLEATSSVSHLLYETPLLRGFSEPNIPDQCAQMVSTLPLQTIQLC